MAKEMIEKDSTSSLTGEFIDSPFVSVGGKPVRVVLDGSGNVPVSGISGGGGGSSFSDDGTNAGFGLIDAEGHVQVDVVSGGGSGGVVFSQDGTSSTPAVVGSDRIPHIETGYDGTNYRPIRVDTTGRVNIRPLTNTTDVIKVEGGNSSAVKVDPSSYTQPISGNVGITANQSLGVKGSDGTSWQNLSVDSTGRVNVAFSSFPTFPTLDSKLTDGTNILVMQDTSGTWALPVNVKNQISSGGNSSLEAVVNGIAKLSVVAGGGGEVLSYGFCGVMSDGTSLYGAAGNYIYKITINGGIAQANVFVNLGSNYNGSPAPTLWNDGTDKWITFRYGSQLIKCNLRTSFSQIVSMPVSGGSHDLISGNYYFYNNGSGTFYLHNLSTETDVFNTNGATGVVHADGTTAWHGAGWQYSNCRQMYVDSTGSIWFIDCAQSRGHVIKMSNLGAAPTLTAYHVYGVDGTTQIYFDWNGSSQGVYFCENKIRVIGTFIGTPNIGVIEFDQTLEGGAGGFRVLHNFLGKLSNVYINSSGYTNRHIAYIDNIPYLLGNYTIYNLKTYEEVAQKFPQDSATGTYVLGITECGGKIYAGYSSGSATTAYVYEPKGTSSELNVDSDGSLRVVLGASDKTIGAVSLGSSLPTGSNAIGSVIVTSIPVVKIGVEANATFPEEQNSFSGMYGFLPIAFGNGYQRIYDTTNMYFLEDTTHFDNYIWNASTSLMKYDGTTKTNLFDCTSFDASIMASVNYGPSILKIKNKLYIPAASSSNYTRIIQYNLDDGTAVSIGTYGTSPVNDNFVNGVELDNGNVYFSMPTLGIYKWDGTTLAKPANAPSYHFSLATDGTTLSYWVDGSPSIQYFTDDEFATAPVSSRNVYGNMFGNICFFFDRIIWSEIYAFYSKSFSERNNFNTLRYSTQKMTIVGSYILRISKELILFPIAHINNNTSLKTVRFVIFNMIDGRIQIIQNVSHTFGDSSSSDFLAAFGAINGTCTGNQISYLPCMYKNYYSIYLAGFSSSASYDSFAIDVSKIINEFITPDISSKTVDGTSGYVDLTTPAIRGEYYQVNSIEFSATGDGTNNQKISIECLVEKGWITVKTFRIPKNDSITGSILFDKNFFTVPSDGSNSTIRINKVGDGTFDGDITLKYKTLYHGIFANQVPFK